jgi:hypothetical protein
MRWRFWYRLRVAWFLRSTRGRADAVPGPWAGIVAMNARLVEESGGICALMVFDTIG